MRIQDVTYRCWECGQDTVYTMAEGDRPDRPECRNCRNDPSRPGTWSTNVRLVSIGAARDPDYIGQLYKGTKARAKRFTTTKVTPEKPQWVKEWEEEQARADAQPPDPELTRVLDGYLERKYSYKPRREVRDD